nr:STAS domain-containing protein [Nocardioides agariphilus]
MRTPHGRFSAVPDLPLTSSYDEHTAVLAVSGDVDAGSTETLRLTIEQCSNDYRTSLEVDLTGVTYLPSVAIGMLVRAEQSFTAAGATLTLAARTGSPAQRVLTVSAMPFRSY